MSNSDDTIFIDPNTELQSRGTIKETSSETQAVDREKADDPIPKCMIKTILVTGGAGFIGSYVADALLTRGDKVVIIDEMNDYYSVKLKRMNLNFLREKHKEMLVVYEGDICEKGLVTNIFEKEKITHVCHLAARAGVRPSIVDPFVYVHSNIEGTTRLLDCAREFNCVNFVYASSSSVYGSSPKSVLTEEDAVDKPVSPYAATKKSCELLAYTFHHLYALPTTGLRFFTVYGPRGRPDMAPFKFIDRISTEQPIQQYGDGTTSRDYTYITDIVCGVVNAIDRPLGCEVINLGNGRPYELKKFITLVERCLGKQAIIEVLPQQPGDVEHTCASIDKARALLGYDPKVTFEEGILRTTDWYLQASKDGLFGDVAYAAADTNSNTGLKRTLSDLELSSLVTKSSKRLTKRGSRFSEE